ncbi:hypothetical protein GCM10022225_12710 [Plantactinospora mayteni]|uniref:Integral membrane protein n=1 Tax=Plantactinospora mayteni TaxID=566021 RepID=A0ABQ4EIB2_9ACTN|nr:hypothetical protein [Plantactinospora mayteni]GIG93976.1 hypothetical protein Pma05_05490 [Plantactinospora mayteni]
MSFEPCGNRARRARTPTLIGSILQWFAETVIGVLEALWELLSVTAFVSLDVTGLPQVTAFASTSLHIVNVCYVLAFLWAAILVMGRDTIQSRVGPGELIPRLVIGLIAANYAIPICSTVIGLANALTAALTGQDITSPGSMQQLRDTTVSALGSPTGATAGSFLLLLIGLLIAVLTGILLVQWIIRLGFLVVAVGVAPIALALHGTEQTEGGAKLWWHAILGTNGIVVLQAVALHTTLTVFLNPDSNLGVLGLPDTRRRPRSGPEPSHRGVPAVGHRQDPRADEPLRHPHPAVPDGHDPARRARAAADPRDLPRVQRPKRRTDRRPCQRRRGRRQWHESAVAGALGWRRRWPTCRHHRDRLADAPSQLLLQPRGDRRRRRRLPGR